MSSLLHSNGSEDRVLRDICIGCVTSLFGVASSHKGSPKCPHLIFQTILNLLQVPTMMAVCQCTESQTQPLTQIILNVYMQPSDENDPTECYPFFNFLLTHGIQHYESSALVSRIILAIIGSTSYNPELQNQLVQFSLKIILNNMQSLDIKPLQLESCIRLVITVLFYLQSSSSLLVSTELPGVDSFRDHSIYTVICLLIDMNSNCSLSKKVSMMCCQAIGLIANKVNSTVTTI